MQSQMGGFCAPAMTAEKLSAGRKLVATLDQHTQAADILNKLLACYDKWDSVPESTLDASTHQSGTGLVVPFSKELVDQLWDHVPWMSELNAMDETLLGLTGELREFGLHLLWYAKEITQDREPITMDKLPQELVQRIVANSK